MKNQKKIFGKEGSFFIVTMGTVSSAKRENENKYKFNFSKGNFYLG